MDFLRSDYDGGTSQNAGVVPQGDQNLAVSTRTSLDLLDNDRSLDLFHNERLRGRLLRHLALGDDSFLALQ